MLQKMMSKRIISANMVKETPFPSIRSRDIYNLTPCLYYPTTPRQSFSKNFIKEIGKTVLPTFALASMLAAVHCVSPNPDRLTPETLSTQPIGSGWYNANSRLEIQTKIDPNHPNQKINGTISTDDDLFCWIYEINSQQICAVTTDSQTKIIGYVSKDQISPN